MLAEEPLEQPCDQLVRPALGRVGLIHGGDGPGDAVRGEFRLVYDEAGLVLEIRVPLQALDLLPCGGEDLGQVDGMHATDHVPVTGDVVLGDEVVDHVESRKLEAGDLGRAVPDAGLAVASVLRGFVRITAPDV